MSALMMFKRTRKKSYVVAMAITILLILVFCDLSMSMTEEERLALREETKEMFFFGYRSYMQLAYPADELMPLSCKGRYRDADEPNRGAIDDALGNYSLTLIDTLDSLVIFEDLNEFERSIRLIIDDVKFDADIVVSVFETNIRVLGGLLSGHILAKEVQERFPDRLAWYSEELLHMAKDIGYRLLAAFNTTSGLPHPRVNLLHGMKSPKIIKEKDTCTACAGTMILEFGALSRLTGNPIFENAARKAMDYIWQQRHQGSDLVGTVLNIQNGDWVRRDSGVGAGIDSYYEYLFKAYVLFGDYNYLARFERHYEGIMKYISQGPLLVDVHMHRPNTNAKGFMDSLLAFWPGLQVFKGDLKPAIETHEMLYQVMQRHNGLLPEAFLLSDFSPHWAQHFLRPEFLESTYFLHKATGDDHYLEVGRQVLNSIQKFARTKCGFASVKDVRTGIQEDRMDSFVLAETFKYLYLLFSNKSELLVDVDQYILTTEAHFLPLSLALHSNKTTAGKSKAVWKRKLPKSSPYTIFIQPGRSDESSIYQTCPNVREIFSKADSRPESIRLALKGYVNQSPRATTTHPTCSSQGHVTRIPKRQLQISAEEFSASNPTHLQAIKKLGITAVILPDGRVQLIHQANLALTNEDAEAGALFMQDMIELSKQQIAKAEEQLRIVSFTSPKTGTKVNLAAGTAHFGPDLNLMGTTVSAQTWKVAPFDACNWPLSGESVQWLKDRIGIVQRGDCMFIQKSRNVQRAGGIGVIVIDNDPNTSATSSPMFAMSGDGSTDVNIPALFLYGQEGQTLLDLLHNHPDIVVHLEPSTRLSESDRKEQEKSSAAIGSNAKPNAIQISEEWFSQFEDLDIDSLRFGSPISSRSSDAKKKSQGVAHVTELPVDDLSAQTPLKQSPSFDTLLNAVATDFTRNIIKQLKTDERSELERRGESIKVNQRDMSIVFNQVLQQSLGAFRELIDEKQFEVLQRVLTVNQAKDILSLWLTDLQKRAAFKRNSGISINPLTRSDAFLKFILAGNTDIRMFP